MKIASKFKESEVSVKIMTIRKNLFLYIIIFFSSQSFVLSEELYFCQTKKSNGFEFIGRDRNEIIRDLGLLNFKIKLSRSREDIIRDIIAEKKKNDGYYIPKGSHFIEMIILKKTPYRYSDSLKCSWRFDIRHDKKKERSFTCVDKQKKTDVFDLDYNGNFFYSSDFGQFYELQPGKKKFSHRETLHTLSGFCKKLVKKK